jgi:hypothetical protein
MAKERLAPRLGFGSLELVPDNPADRQTGLPAPFQEPLGKSVLRIGANAAG